MPSLLRYYPPARGNLPNLNSGIIYRYACYHRSFAALILYFGSFLVYPNVGNLRKENPVKTAFMEYRESEWQREGKNIKIKHRWVPLSRISPYLIKAVIIAEDKILSARGL